jgi:hypothetical protein
LEILNSPEGFEVYSGFEFVVGGSKTIEGARFVLYLSPRAVEDCTDLYYKDFPFELCSHLVMLRPFPPAQRLNVSKADVLAFSHLLADILAF